jgi:ADP-heptose:LPS heptosyltransferase
MTNRGLSKLSLYALDRLTDAFPSFIPHTFQSAFLGILGSNIARSFYRQKYVTQMKNVASFDKILVIVDVNIGDAIIVQESVKVLRHYFPNSCIDYICNHTGGELLSGVSAADNVHNVLRGSGLMSSEDRKTFREIIDRNKYTVILNFFPFLEREDIPPWLDIVHLYVPFASHIIYSWKLNKERFHISVAINDFLNSMLSELRKNAKGRIRTKLNGEAGPAVFKGNSIYLTHDSIDEARAFLAKHNLSAYDHLVYFNPNATSVYTQIPFQLQVQVIKQILTSKDIHSLLLGTGVPVPGIDQKIINELPHELRKKITVVPKLSIGVFAALIDACDVFISGDTGPLHIAASRKKAISSNEIMRNSTAVVSIFGATDSRMYGYDSFLPYHLPSNQNAPSRVFAGYAPCRNITCINKAGKTCKTIRCFDGLDAKIISDYVKNCLQEVHHLGLKQLRKAV